MINYRNPDFSDIPWGRKLAEVYNPVKAEYRPPMRDDHAYSPKLASDRHDFSYVWPHGTESFASRFVAAGVLLDSKFGQTDHSSVESEPQR